MKYLSQTVRTAMIFALAASMLLLSGCGGSQDTGDVETEETSVEPVERPLPTRATRGDPSMATGPEEKEMPSASQARYQVIPRAEGTLAEDGNGLKMIIDASSAEALRDSLVLIGENTSADQYGELERALRFVTTYDPAVLGEPGLMRQAVDGMTAEEVIQHAREISRRRYQRSN